MSLEDSLKAYDLNLDSSFFASCEVFKNLLQKWGRVHNLSANLQKDEIDLNIIDSVYPLSFVDSFSSFADIGSGVGYPGLILAFARKDISAYLIEPRVKRVAFLNFVKASLKLENLHIIEARVENVKDLRVDLITSRAVTNTKLLLQLTQNIKKENSSYLFYKGSMLETELQDLELENYKIVTKDDRNYLYIKGENGL